MAKLETLTEQQWADVARARDAALDRVLSGRYDQAEYEAAAAACYAAIGLPAPRVVVAPGPRTALAWAHQAINDQPLDAEDRPTAEQMRDQVSNIHWSWWRYAWFVHWLHVASIEGVTPPPDDVLELARNYVIFCTPVFTIPLDELVIVCGHWDELHRTDNQLHRTTGPAWSWQDGTKVHALSGIVVPEWAVIDPDPKRILDELYNTEERRVAFAHCGWDRVVKDLQLELLDEEADPHLGALYRIPEDMLEAEATMLIARNASPDRDGTWRTYGLLAAPECKTVREAQASVARLSVAEWEALDGAS